MDNLEEVDKFLEKYDFPKLNHEEIENFNRPITSTEIKTLIRNFPSKKKKSQDHMATQLIVVSYDSLYFCLVCCDFSIFISNFVDLILLPFFS